MMMIKIMMLIKKGLNMVMLLVVLVVTMKILVAGVKIIQDSSNLQSSAFCSQS